MPMVRGSRAKAIATGNASNASPQSTVLRLSQRDKTRTSDKTQQQTVTISNITTIQSNQSTNNNNTATDATIKKHEQIEEVETSTEIEISNTDTDSAQSEKVETSPTQTQQTNEYMDKVETKSPNNQSLDNDTKVREPTVKVDTKTNINKELTLDVIQIKIDKRVASAIVDTGANYCLIDPSIIADMKIDISNKETFNIQSPVFENTSTTSNQSVNLEIDINNHKFTMLFVVTPIRAIYKVIIEPIRGRPNPTVMPVSFANSNEPH
ncbi:hypothetical protein SAMD00019534_113000 [Acytostelium subglobosum LB1]|uniref:hypothetical protein n=1 Tax=Acytostelium subglobosum LB1 TaxID=1410327 RepID=UPI0006447D11|nr:hypothetical protein SAMD00019534_113000 [Acytostelium subglobosum LB1]GAM28124.1 hypothetical protein SAMD00019534_113000 [Acytostelium subglobosum LB1]|eukprot:XP_012749083.1 hypothetical protein SAMD00019534_113000 [Acytostelium subglobosum LB1]